MFSLICARINGWVNNPDAGDSRRRHRAYYDVIVMYMLDKDSDVLLSLHKHRNDLLIHKKKNDTI